MIFNRGNQRGPARGSQSPCAPRAMTRNWLAGFLFTEGLIHEAGQIERITTDQDDSNPNVIEVALKPGVTIELERLTRNFYTTSSCGVCGKSSLAALQTQAQWSLTKNEPQISFATIHEMPKTLREKQRLFADTGGLHAAALFDAEGKSASASARTWEGTTPWTG
ncbi:MAG: formate dehydrogenase accessory sulfurtransferase FdhD [Chthoniobacteraceae bacterium]